MIEKVWQLGIVVNNIDQKLENYKKLLGLGENEIPVINTTDLPFDDKLYYGKPVEYDLKIAMLDIGGLQFELIQPLNESGDPYSDFLKEKGEGIHHIHVNLKDNDTFINLMEKEGIKELTSGNIAGAEFFYYDTLEKLGVIIEGSNLKM